MLKTNQIMRGCFQVIAADVAILFGCPSEIVKVFKNRGEKMPRNIVLPYDFYCNGEVQANLEFPLYDFLFMQQGFSRGEKLRVIGFHDQIRRIREILSMTVLGSPKETMQKWGIKDSVIEAQLKISTYLGLKKSDGSVAQIDDFVEFVSFKDEEKSVIVDGIKIIVNDKNVFTVEHEKESIPIDINFQGHQAPPIPILPPLVQTARPAFGLISLSKCTSGFDPSGYTTGFILWINSTALMIDGVPWTKEHLNALGINAGEIQGSIISHVHEDHTSIMELIINGKKATIITTKDIFQAFLSKISNILGWEERRVFFMMKFIEVIPGVPFNWYGAKFNFFRTVHTVSTIGFSAEYCGKKITYCADTAWGRTLLPLYENGIVNKEQYDMLSQLPKEKADVVIIDGGAGQIHPFPEDLEKVLEWEEIDRTYLTHRSSVPADCGGFKVMEPGTQVELISAKNLAVDNIDAILNAPIIRELPSVWKNAILSLGTIKNVSANSTILKQGFPGKDFYIILGGTFSVRNGNEEVARLGTEDFFGEFSIMHDKKCSATVKAISNGKILEVPKELFLQIVRNNQIGKWLNKIHKVRPVIMNCGFLRDLPSSIVNKLISKTTENKYLAGDEIIHQGDEGDEFFIVKSGRVRVFVEKNGLEETELATLFSGQYFGEMALISGGKRTATAIAETDTEVLIIERADFEEFLKEVPSLNYVFGVMADKRAFEQ